MALQKAVSFTLPHGLPNGVNFEEIWDSFGIVGEVYGKVQESQRDYYIVSNNLLMNNKQFL